MVGPNDNTNEAIGCGWVSFAMAGKLLWRTFTWRQPAYIMAVQVDPHDNSTPALGTEHITPLIDRQVSNGWSKENVAKAIERVDSRRAAGRVILIFE